MKPRVGTTLASTTDSTKVVVIRWGDADLDVTCGGVAMAQVGGSQATATAKADPAQQSGTQIGKRYADEKLGVELLCTKAGTGTLAVDGSALPIKGAKPLPASD